MVSSQLHHHIAGFDEIIDENSSDFVSSGLKRASVIRAGRLAVVDGSILLGAIGTIAAERLQRIKTHLADWLSTA
jgi:mRNA interferase MazF